MAVDIHGAGLSEAEWTAWLTTASTAWHIELGGSVVVVAPHPDDEVFGVGGLMHDVAAAGGRVTVVAVTDGEGAYGRATPDRAAMLSARRDVERRAALDTLGVADANVVRVGLPDGAVADHEQRLTAVIAEVAAEADADLVVAPWRHDGHPDHDASGRAAAVVGRPLAEYLVWAWQWARPDDLPPARLRYHHLSSGTRAAKAAAVAVYVSQIEPSPDGRPVVPPTLLERFRRDREVVLV